MQMPARTYIAGNYGSLFKYKFGFNGSEVLNELPGGYDFGYRINNVLLGRFLSTDRLTSKYPYYSPYVFAGNKPIIAIDMEGLEENYLDAVRRSLNTSVQLQTIRQNSPPPVPYAPSNQNITFDISAGADINSSLIKNVSIDYNISTGNISGSVAFSNSPGVGIKKDLSTINFNTSGNSLKTSNTTVPPASNIANQLDALSIYKIKPQVDIPTNPVQSESSSFDFLVASSSQTMTTITQIEYPNQYKGTPYKNAPIKPNAILNTYQITETEGTLGGGLGVSYDTYNVSKNGQNIYSGERSGIFTGKDFSVGGKNSPASIGVTVGYKSDFTPINKSKK